MQSAQHARLAAIRGIDRTKLVAPDKRFNPDFARISSGAVVSFENRTYVVRSVSFYDETSWNFKKNENFRVYEWQLFCLETGETVWFEWECDDEVVAYLSTQELDSDPRKYGATDWKSFLDDDRLDSSLRIRHGGKSFGYDDDESWAAKYYRNGQGEPQYVRAYEFESASGECLTVEAWGKNMEGGVQVWLSRRILPSAVTLLVQGS